MKRFFILFAVCLLIIFSGLNNSAFSASWDQLSQNEREAFINQSIEDMKSFRDIDISKDTLENIFGIKSSRDTNYKEHNTGKTSLNGVIVKNTSWSYLMPGPSYLGKSGPSMQINSGYTLSNDNITLSFNKSGNLTEIKTKTPSSANGTYIVKKYNKYKKLIEIIFYDGKRTIYFNQNGDVEFIKENGISYNIEGKILKNKKGSL
ncbi:hypothetical protein DBY21_06345 [Candidatus Gastranaerophilales bacterium]|nr:MAG: hypothetical protein DBY21_06345 [Candidatus Gastranaerophilales bacterium]